MESGVPNSFIPQDATIVSSGNRHEGAGLGELILLMAIVSFIVSAALGVAALFYSQYLSVQSASKLHQLQIAKDAFDPALIQTYTRLDDRMNSADVIMKNHIAPTAFFVALNQLTLTTISFKTLNFDTSNLNTIILKATGVARSVNSVALEADILSKSGIIVDPIFSNINRGEDGVDFDLTAQINPANLNYSQLVASNAIPSVDPTNGGSAPSGVSVQQTGVASSTVVTASTTVPTPQKSTTTKKQ